MNNDPTFSIEQIAAAHATVKSGADFPRYIRDIRRLGVIKFETWVIDSHTAYFGEKDFTVQSEAMYSPLFIADTAQKGPFEQYLKLHQQGATDYLTFCKHCAETGVKKWIVDLDKLTCTYFDKEDNEVLMEHIPQV